MSIVRLAACSAVALSLAACGAARAARTQPAPTATSSPVAGLQFVAPPVLTFRRDDRGVDLWVRLNRPLRHTIGHAGEFQGSDAALSIPNVIHDGVVGMESHPLTPTCYSEGVWLEKDAAPLVDGAPVEVTLWLDDTHRLTATATAQELAEGETAVDEVKALGCPNRAPGLPPVRACHGDAQGDYLVSVVSARGTTCARGLTVMRDLARDATARCYRTLCIRGNVYRHYRCRAALMGEAAWDIVCRRGKAEIHGYAAD